ncbi:polycystic kidney disease and receptor for egg jelly-related protein-like [Pseudonaja textilis]|uniref:polycystic kidney disease and receptor for egg jelly-related protein-like n=1 Tax=Pseudonaja textilis TaxID=8673 RepID=UPI000EA83A14|nr:polycystic kidney disease and receptor for egg jelly-related protein-like [Pseudonaja textilis]
MHCPELLVVLLGYVGQCTKATPSHIWPPPLQVTCSNAQHRVYQKHDTELSLSCIWDGQVDLRYSRMPGGTPETERGEPDPQLLPLPPPAPPPPHCQWYQDATLVMQTHDWSGQLVLNKSLDGERPYSSWALTRIVMQCVSALCGRPPCPHHNFSVEISRQDIHLFLLSPQSLPIWEWQPVTVGWCARLKSSPWSYRLKSEGGSPAGRLIPSNQYGEPFASTQGHPASLPQVCAVYYHYYVTLRYPQRGFYIVLLHLENGPPLSLSLDIQVQPALLHVFSAASALLSRTQKSFTLSWSLRPLSSSVTAYTLEDLQGREAWSLSYNPFALPSNFCAPPASQASGKKVISRIYFRTSKTFSEMLRGHFNFSNDTLVCQGSRGGPMSIRLNPQKIKVGMYFFIQEQGFSYSSLESSGPSSLHHLFFQQEALSTLISIEFVKKQWFKFNVHLYLNRKESLFKSLAEKEMEVHVSSGHSPNKNFVYIVWFIPVPHPDLQCDWAFHLQLFHSRKEHLLWNKTYTYRDRVQNAVRFLPHSVFSFRPTQYTGFVAEVNCRQNGLVRAVLTAALGTYASKVMEPAVPCEKSYCRKLIIVIHKPNPSEPVLRYKREKAITLQATAEAKCGTCPDLDFLWKIYKLSTVWSIPDWLNPLALPEGMNTRGIVLHIPENVLPCGFYHVNLTMSVHLLAENITFVLSDSVFLQILESGLRAVIAGGLFRIVGISDRWSLDGSLSLDPDSIEPLEGILFHWFCSKRELDYSAMKLGPGQKCHSRQRDLHWTYSNEPVQVVEPKTLQENTKYYFKLVTIKTNQSAHAFQAVHVLADSGPVLRIICLENCEKGIQATERLILYGKCLNCEKAHLVYFWCLLSADSKEIYFDWASKTTTGRTSPYLHIHSLAFRSMADQLYILKLKVSMQGVQLAVGSYSFYVHIPPQIGKCFIEPREGIALMTKFTLQCTGFDGKKGPLLYRVIARSDLAQIANISSLQNNTLGTIVYLGHQQNTPPSFLPSGTPSEKYALNIFIQVYDTDGAFSQVSLQATVYESRTSKPTDVILNELYQLVRQLNSSASVLPDTEDYFHMGFVIYMVASELNNIEPLPNFDHSKTELREMLLNESMRIPMTETGILNQIISSLCQITQNANEVSRKSQLAAVQILRKTSEALERRRAIDLGSEEAEVLASGIFTGLSNVLRASLLNPGNGPANTIKEIISVSELLADIVLQGKVPGEDHVNMEAKGWSIRLWKDENRDISRTVSEGRSCKNCFYPKVKLESQAELPADAPISVVHYVFEKNPFPWLMKAVDNHTVVMGFKVAGAKANGDIIGVIPKVAEVIMDRIDKDPVAFNLTIGLDKKRVATAGGFSIEVNRTSPDVYVQILCHRNITFNVSIYLGLNFSSPPIVSYVAFSDKPPTPQKRGTNIECAIKAPYLLCLPQALLWSEPGSKWNISVVLRSPPVVRKQTTKIVCIVVFTARCRDLGHLPNFEPSKETCHLGPETRLSKLHCICGANPKMAQLQLSKPLKPEVRFVGGTFVIYPNPLDIKKVLLADFDTNPVTVLTVFFIFAGYIFCSSWAIIRDKDDMRRKEKIFVLPDNDPYHRMHYLITIYTGSRLGSGTTADVFLELIGKDGYSDVHRMKHPKFPTQYRTAVDTFLFATRYDLGDIYCIHIWHNNAGSSPNWYLSRVKVFNVDTQRSWLFICRNWLGLGKADGKIERYIFASNLKTRLEKMDYFLIHLASDLEDNHLWLSIFSQVVTGTFNRVQRVSCCLAIMLSTLLLNIMFYSGSEEEIIPLKFRILRSMYIGFFSALCCVPLQVTMTVLFRYSMEKPSDDKEDMPDYSPSSSETSEEDEESSSSSTTDEEEEAKAAGSTVNVSEKEPPKISTRKRIIMLIKMFTRKPQFAWWWRYVAWAIVFFMSFVSAVFIILYGFTYGSSASTEWFIASMTSFFESVFLLQTLKMALISGVSTISIKYCKNITWISAEQYQKMKLIRVNIDPKEVRKIHHELVRIRQTREYEPLEEDEVVILRKRVRAQHLAFVFIKDIICHIIFASCVLTVAYTTLPTVLFYHNKFIHDKFNLGLSKVTKLEDIYLWMGDTFVPLIHNDYQPTYLSDSWSKILGLPRMRQVRGLHLEKPCFSSGHFANNYLIGQKPCHYDFAHDPEDQKHYLGSWTKPIDMSVSSHISNFQGFTYQSDIDQWEYKSYGVVNIYGPGGYSFYFFPGEQRLNTTMRLETLQSNKWLDKRTRALIFELTTFTLDVDLYCSITIIFEFTNFGVISSTLSIHSYKLSKFKYETTPRLVVYGIMIYILVFYLADEFHMLRQERIGYLKTATNLNNFAIKNICMFFILLIALKFKMAYTLLEFYLLNPEEFVPFHVVSQIDQLYTMVAGILGFLLVLKPYRYFRFLYKMRLAEQTLSKVFPVFLHLTILAALLFCTFMSFGYLIFGQHEWSFSTWVYALQTVVFYCFSGFKQLDVASRWWLTIFFQVSFLFTVVFIFVNFWRSLLMSTYTSMKQTVYEQHSDEAEAINFLYLKLRSIWRNLTRQPDSGDDYANVTIFGKSVDRDSRQPGLKYHKIEGKKMVSLTI